jgi:CHAD domain-containing protein
MAVKNSSKPFRSRVAKALMLTYARSQGALWAFVRQSQVKDERIHDLRGALKRLRSVVSLMELSGMKTGTMDDRLGAWSRQLGSARDQAVVQAWLEKNSGGIKLLKPISPPRAEAKNRRIRPIAKGVRALIVEMAERLARDEDGIDVVSALKKSFKRARDSWAKATFTGKPKDFHRLGKRIKHLQYQIEACRKETEGAEKVLKELRKLSQSLGNLNDLWLVENFLEFHSDEMIDGRAVFKKLRDEQLAERKSITETTKAIFSIKSKAFVTQVFDLEMPSEKI